MQFTTALFALAAATAANAASDLGAWNVTIESNSAANGYRSRTVLADFASDAYAGDDVIRTVCKYEFIPGADGAKETESCEPNTFSYEYDGTSKCPLLRASGIYSTRMCVLPNNMLTTKQLSRFSRTSRSPTP